MLKKKFSWTFPFALSVSNRTTFQSVNTPAKVKITLQLIISEPSNQYYTIIFISCCVKNLCFKHISSQPCLLLGPNEKLMLFLMVSVSILCVYSIHFRLSW